MKLSIMFITRNRKHELVRAIDSCLKQGIEDMEFIIVDNNSDNGTQEYIEEYLKTQRARYKYFYSEENLGVAGGRNKAFSLAQGDYVFTLDDDAIIDTEDFFKKICRKMDLQSNIVAAAVKIYEPESGNYLIGKVYKSKSRCYKDNRAFSFVGCAHILRRDYYKNQKLYPEKLVFGSEELYPSLAAHKDNKIIAYFDDLKVLHLPSSIARVKGKERKLNFILNIHIVRKLCYPVILHPLLEITLRLRILKHGLTEYKRYNEIMKLYKTRYDHNEMNRMSVVCFWRLVRDVGPLYLL